MRLLRKWFNKIPKKKTSIILGGLFVFGFVFLQISPASAQVDQIVGDSLKSAGNAFVNGMLILISGLLSYVVEALGKFLVIIIDFIQAVSKYDGFRTQEQVIKGWKIVRDTVNSFYVIVLIAIAISTIIRWKPLDFRVALPRLIISAVIVNFSRTICLFAIAFSTILMNTFINAIGGAWPAFILGLRAPAILALQESTVQGLVVGELSKSPSVMGGSIIVSQLFAITTLVIAIVPLVAFLLILLFRIIALWILIILSPLAFFLWGLVVKGGEYFNEWKNEFIKQILIGPVFAFFLYIIVLFFIANAQTVVDQSVADVNVYGIKLIKPGNVTRPLPSVLSDPSLLLGYIVGIALMFVTLEVANRIGARGTSSAIGAAKKFRSGLRRAATGSARLIGKGAYKGFRLADDYAYSTGKVPTLRGAQKGVEALTAGFKAKREGLVTKGAIKRSQLAQDLEGEGPGSVAATLANLGAGNADFVKSTNWVVGKDSLVSRLLPKKVVGKIYGEDAIAETDDLHKKALGLYARRDAKSAYENLDESTQNLVANKNLSQIVSDKEDIGSQISTLQQSKERLAEMDRLLDQDGRLLEEEDFSQEYDDLQRSVGGFSDYEEKMAGLKKTEQDLTDVEAIFSNENLDIKDTDTIAAYAQTALSDSASAQDGKSLASVVKEMNSRKQRAQIAGAQIRTDLRKRGKEFREGAFEKDEKYSIEYLAALAAENANEQNIPEFQEVVIKAADQGGFDNLYSKMIPGFKMDHEGLKKAHQYNMDVVKMSEQQSLELLSRVEGRNWADKNAIQTGFTKTGKTGKLEITSKAEQNQIIRKNIENNLKEVLLKGGKDAIGIKQNNGSYKLHEVAEQVIRENISTVEKILEDNRVATGLNNTVKQMLREKATGPGGLGMTNRAAIDNLR